MPLDSMVMQQRYRLGYLPVPELVVIPAGSFDMGEQSKEFLNAVPEKVIPNFGFPGRRVDIAQGFSLGKYEVTYEQFDRYVWDRHRAGHGDVAYPTTVKGGRGTRPVVNVTWPESMAYAAWLGERTHQNCRLPTEAEWEFAARAKPNGRIPGEMKSVERRTISKKSWRIATTAAVPGLRTNQLPWGVFHPMRLVFTTRRETCGSGPARCGARRLMGMSSDVPSREILGSGWYAAGPGSMAQPTRARPPAPSPRAPAPTRSAFGYCVRPPIE